MAQTAHGIVFYDPTVDDHVTIDVPAADVGTDPQSFLVSAHQFVTVEVGPDPMSDEQYLEYLLDLGLPEHMAEAALERRSRYGEYAKVYSHASFEFQGNSSGGNNAPKKVAWHDSTTIESGFGYRTEEDSNIPKGGGTYPLTCRARITRAWNGSIAHAESMVGWWVEYA